MEPYKSGLEFIGAGVEACWQNSDELIKFAKLIQSHGNCGLALSLAVLSMEEIGKLLLIDGLLFSKQNDEISALFENGYKSHKLKLKSLDAFPILLTYLANFNERYSKDSTFRYTIVAVIKQYQQDRMELIPWIGKNCDLTELDKWKQRGFYSQYDSNGQFTCPREVNKVLSDAVIKLAFRIVDAVDFVLKNNIDRYKKSIEAMRASITEDDLEVLRNHTQEIVTETFEYADNES